MHNRPNQLGNRFRLHHWKDDQYLKLAKVHKNRLTGSYWKENTLVTYVKAPDYILTY